MLIHNFVFKNYYYTEKNTFPRHPRWSMSLYQIIFALKKSVMPGPCRQAPSNSSLWNACAPKKWQGVPSHVAVFRTPSVV